jgi:ABC-type amino acid transport substrate-binding protein
MQRKRLWKIGLAVTLIVAIVLVATVFLRLRQPREPLLVGMDPTFPPFCTKQADGNYCGFEIDLVESLARDLNRRLEIVEIAFRDLLAALQDGTVHLVVSGMPIRPDREAVASFSLPYYDATQVAVARAADQRQLCCLADLVDLRVAAKLGTTGEFEAVALKGAAQSKGLHLMREEAAMFEALTEDAVDVVLVDRQLAMRYVTRQYAELCCYELDCWEEKYAVAVPIGQELLLERVNAFLVSWMQSPAYEQAMDRWFGP